MGADGSFQVEGVDAEASSVRGELDLANAREFETLLYDTLRDRAGPFLIDMSGVTFIDSSGVQALERVVDLCDGADIVIRASRQVFAVLQIVGLTDAWENVVVVPPDYLAS